MEDPTLSSTHSFAIKSAALGWVSKCPNYSVVSALAGQLGWLYTTAIKFIYTFVAF